MSALSALWWGKAPVGCGLRSFVDRGGAAGDGFLHGQRFLVVDNAPSFTKQFDGILAAAGVNVTRTAIQAPNMNSFAERWVQSAKRECLSRMIVYGERHLRRVLGEYVAHYNRDRPHQGIGNGVGA